jgi:hypothetical protein
MCRLSSSCAHIGAGAIRRLLPRSPSMCSWK